MTKAYEKAVLDFVNYSDEFSRRYAAERGRKSRGIEHTLLLLEWGICTKKDLKYVNPEYIAGLPGIGKRRFELIMAIKKSLE